jgi:hypothetical protein
VATANTGESREVNSYRDKQQYKKMDNRYGVHPKVEENNFRSKDNTYRSRENSRPSSDEYRTRDNFNNRDNTRAPKNGYRQGNNGFRPKDSSYKATGSNAWKGNNYTGHKKSSVYLPDKDDEEDSRAAKGRKQPDSKVRTQNKDSELAIDKLETMKRLEREKKAMQKKIHEEDVVKRGRPAVKQKREVKD